MDRLALGRIGEQAAADALAARGYLILERNVRSRFGELDLIAAQGEDLVFIEVKTRTTEDCGQPFDAIHPLKQHRLARLALSYMQAKRMSERSCRFDAVSVLLSLQGKVQAVEVLANAFDVPPR